MTKEDISNAVHIYFAKKYKIKLFKNEKTYGIFKNKEYVAVKNIGYPAGYPDEMGYRITDGKVCGVENKTINDNLSKKQKDMLSLMVSENCLVYLAKETKNGNIKLTDYKTKEFELIEIVNNKIIA